MFFPENAKIVEIYSAIFIFDHKVININDTKSNKELYLKIKEKTCFNVKNVL